MLRRPRLAFCITELDPGGAERALVQLVTRLPRDEWDIKVFCLSGPGEMCAPLEAAGIPVECLGAESSRSWGVLRRLKQSLKDWQPDLLQTYLFHANIAGRWVAARAGGPIVVSGLRASERDSPWRLRVDRWTNRWVDMNVCVSEGVAEFARSVMRLPAEKVVVIPNGVDAERLMTVPPASLAQFGIPSGATVLTFVGRLHHQKGPDLLLDAMLPVLMESPEVHLLIVGDGPERGMIERRLNSWSAREGSPSDSDSPQPANRSHDTATDDTAGVARRVHLVGRQQDVPGILKSSHGLLLPSRWEGMPNVVLEAAAVGCPLVVTDVEGVQQVLDYGRLGWVVPIDSAETFSRAVQELLLDPEATRRRADASQHHVKEHFTWSKVVDEYAALYRRLLKR